MCLEITEMDFQTHSFIQILYFRRVYEIIIRIIRL